MGHEKRPPSSNGTGPAIRGTDEERPALLLKEGEAKISKEDPEVNALSKFLQADSVAVQERVERIQELLGSEAQLTLAQRADLVYNRRPEILELVSDLQQAYLVLAKRYDHVAGKVVRLTKSADSPTFDTPILQPLSATKHRPAKRTERSSNGGVNARGSSAKSASSEAATATPPESSSLNPDAPPFVGDSPPPLLNPEAPSFTPSKSPVSANGESTPASTSQRGGSIGAQQKVGPPAEDDPETPQMSTFRFQETKGSGSYNVEKEGPLHAGHLFSDFLAGGEGPVHAGHVIESWVPESRDDEAAESDIREVMSPEVASNGGKAGVELEGEALRDSQPLSAFLYAAQIQEAASQKQGPKKRTEDREQSPKQGPKEREENGEQSPKQGPWETAPQLKLGAGTEEGPVHAGHALMIRGASTRFEREIRLTAQLAEALARDEMQARKLSELDLKIGLPDGGVKPVSLLKEMMCQRGGGSDGEKELEGIGVLVQDSGQVSGETSDVEPEGLHTPKVEVERLRAEVDDLIAQKKEAIRYLTGCVDEIRQEKKSMAAAVAQLAAENFSLRERLEEVLQGGGGVWSWGVGDDRQEWGDVIAEALEYGGADFGMGGAQNGAGPSSSRASESDGRKQRGIVIREPGEVLRKESEDKGESSGGGAEAGDRKGKGKVEEFDGGAPDASRGGGGSALHELREENERLRRALAAVNGQRSRR